MRKLATIQKISEIKPIKDADRIVAYRVNGWWIVDQKDKYKVGDFVIYCEIDSWIPHEIAPFLSKGKEPREFNGVKGEKLRTIRLKKQISQGLLLPLVLENFTIDVSEAEGTDLSEILNIQKWEKPVPPQLAGTMKGNFPSKIPKTDQERIQNIPQIIVESYNAGRTFEVTEKLEGSSMTCYILENDDGEFEFGVCSRNIDLKRDDANSFWEVAIRDGIEEKLKTLGQEIAIQGELIGPGVQGNIYGLTKLDFYVYDIYNVEIGEYVKPDQRQKMVSELGLKHVPILDVESKLTLEAQDLLDGANGKSKIGVYPKREGQVWKDTKGGLTFKIISNEYLNSMSEED